jgi:hypothetical protein
LLANPPEWLGRQADKHLEKPSGRTLNPLCVAVATHLYGDAGRWQEVKPAVERWLEGGDWKRHAAVVKEAAGDYPDNHPLDCDCAVCL